MVSYEYLEILKQGVEVWNKWREDNPNIKPDLSHVNFCRVGLMYVGLNEADIMESAICEGALMGVDFSEVDLTSAILSGSDLRSADFVGARLVEANLRGANLRGVDLRGVDLNGADLTGANFSEADLSYADLSEACLCSADLITANLQNANLEWSQLINCNLTDATLTGCKLYGSARDNWVLKGVQCLYIYFDERGQERLPKGRDFADGEFERLYASLPTIEYVFENGFSPIDPVIMAKVVEFIQGKEPDFEIQIDSINTRGLVPSMKFIVQHEEQKTPALQQVIDEYKNINAKLMGQNDNLLKAVYNMMEKPSEIKNYNISHTEQLTLDGDVEKSSTTVKGDSYGIAAGKISESTISQNIKTEYHMHATDLKKVIEEEPEGSESFAKLPKKKAMDIIGGVVEDCAKGIVKNAAKEVFYLGAMLGTVIVQSSAYQSFVDFVSNIGR